MCRCFGMSVSPNIKDYDAQKENVLYEYETQCVSLRSVNLRDEY
jgi:hypothetical protein